MLQLLTQAVQGSLSSARRLLTYAVAIAFILLPLMFGPARFPAGKFDNMFVPAGCLLDGVLQGPAAPSKLKSVVGACCSLPLACSAAPRLLSTGDVKKLQFTIDAMGRADPFASSVTLHDEVQRAFEWQAARSAVSGTQGLCLDVHVCRSPQAVMGEREAIMANLEREADAMWCASSRC